MQVFESVLRESEQEPTHPSVLKNVPILLDVIVGFCEYDQHLVEGREYYGDVSHDILFTV